MSIAAVSSVQIPAVAPQGASEEANESSAEKAREASQPTAAVKSSPAPGTGTILDVSA